MLARFDQLMHAVTMSMALAAYVGKMRGDKDCDSISIAVPMLLL